MVRLPKIRVMPFTNFDNYSFMFDRLAKPIVVGIPQGNPKARDDDGLPIKPVIKYVSLDEPVKATTNPNYTFTSVNGGVQSTITMIWESKSIRNAPKGTSVSCDHQQYQVNSGAAVPGTDLFIYQLKAVGSHD